MGSKSLHLEALRNILGFHLENNMNMLIDQRQCINKLSQMTPQSRHWLQKAIFRNKFG